MSKSKLAHNPKQKQYFERELSILQMLRHYNITRLHEYFEDEATICMYRVGVSARPLLWCFFQSG